MNTTDVANGCPNIEFTCFSRVQRSQISAGIKLKKEINMKEKTKKKICTCVNIDDTTSQVYYTSETSSEPQCKFAFRIYSVSLYITVSYKKGIHFLRK